MKNVESISFVSASVSHTYHCVGMNCIKPECNRHKEKDSIEYHLHFFNFILNDQNLF